MSEVVSALSGWPRPQWNGMPVASLAMLLIGGVMRLAIAHVPTTAPGAVGSTFAWPTWLDRTKTSRWIAAGALGQADVEEALYAAAVANGLVADDGERQCWATIRSGLSAGLQKPVDLDADDRAPRRRRTA